MGKGLFVLFLVFSRWFWFPSSVPPCWQSSLPQGLALCCGACVLGDRADYPPTLFFGGACFCWPLLACRDPALLFCSLLFVVCGRVFSPSKKVFTCLVFGMLMNDSHQGVILVLSQSCPQFTLLLLAVQALRETTSCSIPGDLTR